MPLSGYPEAPISARDLADEDVTRYRNFDDRPVGGPLAPHVRAIVPWPRFEVGHDDDDDYEKAALPRVRAFPVPALHDVLLETASEDAIPSALESQLSALLPGVLWIVPRDLSGALRKYGLLHTSVAAPPDTTTGQPMAVEIAGNLETVAGEPVSDFIHWRLSRQERREDWDTPLPGPLRVRLTVATYANVRYPGIGVGFYL